MQPPILSDLLAAATIQNPSHWKGLTVFPLVTRNGHAPTCVLIDDLLDGHEAEIGEVSEGGVVPTIKVLNRSPHDALILDGTELLGARQNRMVNVTIVAGHGTETCIPVSCVEAGRWAYRSRGFASSKRTVASHLRNLKAHRVAEHLERSGVPTADQGEVWEHVRSYHARSGTASPTGAMHDSFTHHRDGVEAAVSALGSLDAQGAVVAIDGEIVALDLFDHRDTFRKAWPALLRGYALDAILSRRNGSKGLTRRAACQRLRKLAARAVSTPHSVPGVGEYWRVQGPGVAGGIARHQGRVVHLAVFPALKEP